MESEGMITILKYMHNYDGSANPHAYLSKIAQHAFKQYVDKQKKHSYIKDKLYNMDMDLEDEYMEKAFNYEIMKNKEEIEFTKPE